MSNLEFDEPVRILPRYWNGPTGQAICNRGGGDALLLGVYVLANRYVNTIGLYHLPFHSIRIGLTPRRIASAFEALDGAEFATYDYGTQYVWVREMARFRMGIKNKHKCLPLRDNRNIHVARAYTAIAERTPFAWSFFQRYRKTFSICTGIRSSIPLIKQPPFAIADLTEGLAEGLAEGLMNDHSGTKDALKILRS